MLKEYEHIIYTNEEEKKKMEQECVDEIYKHYPQYSKENILCLVLSNEPIDIVADYQMEICMAEGMLLFDKTVEKFGSKLWQGQAWKNKTCKRKCPFGDICEKKCIKIDDDIFCYGQLYYRKITWSEIEKMAKSHHVQLVDSDGTIIINLNTANKNDKEFFSAFFFDYEDFVMWFGDYQRHKRKVNGSNVIGLL